MEKRLSSQRCLKCGSANVKANGWKGEAQQFRCMTCGKSWTFAHNWLVRRDGRAVRPPTKRVVGALALCSLGIPKRQVEKLVGIKAETIHRHLLRTYTEGWGDELTISIAEHFGSGIINNLEVADLLMHLELKTSRSEAAMFSNKFKIFSESKQLHLLARASQIVGSTVKYDGKNFSRS
jgi:transposase-like protein